MLYCIECFGIIMSKGPPLNPLEVSLVENFPPFTFNLLYQYLILNRILLIFTMVEGGLTIVIFNTDNLSTDIFDHRILLYRNSLLRILDHRNFIHQNFEGGILYTEICTPEFSP